MSRISYVQTKGLPASHAAFPNGGIGEGKFIFVAGQGPYDPALDKFVGGSIAKQTKLTLDCLRRVIEEAGGDIKNIVNCRVYLHELNEQTVAELHEACAEYFGDHQPSYTVIGAKLLDIGVEIDCIALL